MMKNTKPPLLHIDEVGSNICTGWYARYDGESAALFLERGSTLIPIQVDVKRDDVMEAGLSDISHCGFLIEFMPRLKYGETFRIYDNDHNQLYEYTEENPMVQPSAAQYKMMELVEPFVDLDIKKILQRLMTDKIYSQYVEMYRQILRGKTDQDLREEWINILADMKTTQHLLCSAYLEQARYKDPDFLQDINEQRLVPESKIEFNLCRKLTGTNWGEGDNEGRWTKPGNPATLLLPRLPAGIYRINLSLLDAIGSNPLPKLSILLDGQPVEWTYNRKEIPCDLEMTVNLPPADRPFMTLTFLGEEGSTDQTAMEDTNSAYKFGKLLCSPC